MKNQKINVNIPMEQLIEEATTIEVWEEMKPAAAEFTNFVLCNGKVISAKGSIKINDVEYKCIWNYQGICINKWNLTVIEEGCL